MIKAVIFDFDMVLINSMKQVILYNKYLFKHFNIEFPKKKGEVRKLYTWDSKRIYNYFAKRKVSEKEYFRFIRGIDFRKYLKYIKLNKNTKKIIDYLNKNKIKTAIATNGDHSIFLIMDYFKIKKYFNVVLTAKDIKKPKPNAESLNSIIKKLKLKKSEVLYVGDDIIDIETAKRAKVKVALYKNKFKGADYYIGDLMGIKELI